MSNTQCKVKPVYALENVNVSQCIPSMANGRDADALPLTIKRRVSCDALRSNVCDDVMYKGRVASALSLPVDRRVSCEALRSNGCNDNMKSVARVADALRLPDGNDMRVADALHLPVGTAVMRDAVALHLPVTLIKGQ